MKRISSFILLLFFISLLCIVTCKKEYSYEGGRTAEYTLLGAPLQCAEAISSGNYYAGLALDSSSFIQVRAKVTAAGNYTLATEKVNGISFGTAGSFADTGTYTVILYGSGTPDSAGTFTFLIPGTSGCSFSVAVTNPADATYTLSGDPGDCGNPVAQGSFTEGIAMNTTNVVTINVNVATAGPFSISTNTANGFSFSASGTFTSTGTQQVILQATGKPETPELTPFRLQGAATECTFYVGVGNAEPVATYVLQSAATNSTLYCSPGSVQGAYTAGTPLSSGNTLTVNAYVTVLGNYTVSTTEQNGIMFSHTGMFTTIGAQDVVLQGTGTPTASGDFLFTPQIVGPSPIGGASCGLDVTVQ